MKEKCHISNKMANGEPMMKHLILNKTIKTRYPLEMLYLLARN